MEPDRVLTREEVIQLWLDQDKKVRSPMFATRDGKPPRQRAEELFDQYVISRMALLNETREEATWGICKGWSEQ